MAIDEDVQCAILDNTDGPGQDVTLKKEKGNVVSISGCPYYNAAAHDCSARLTGALDGVPDAYSGHGPGKTFMQSGKELFSLVGLFFQGGRRAVGESKCQYAGYLLKQAAKK